MAGSASFVQTSFLGGEWSKFAQGSYDDPFYKKALNVCINSYPVEEGAWMRRSGFQYVGTSRSGNPGRLLPFLFSGIAPYNIEFTDGHVRLVNGTKFVTANDSIAVSSLSASGASTTMVLAISATWATGDQGYFTAANPVSTQAVKNLLGRVFTITGSGTTFTLTDPVTGQPVPGTLTGWTTGLAVTFNKIVDFVSPYTNQLWKTVRIVQSEHQNIGQSQSTALFFQANTPAQALTLVTPPTATQFGRFTLSTAVFKDGPYFDPVQSGAQIVPTGQTGIISLTLQFQAYVATTAYSAGDFVTSVNVGYQSLVDGNLGNTPASNPTFWQVVSPGAAVGPNGFQASDIGRMIRLLSQPAAYVAGTTYGANQAVLFNGTTYTSIATGNLGNQPDISPAKWAISPTAQVWTWGKITSLSTIGLISGTLSGSTNIGDMTSNGGLAAAFDGNTSKSVATCAFESVVFQSTGYVGKNYTGASAQKISSVVVTPSNTAGFETGSGTLTVTLRAKQTPPAASNDGTILGTSALITDTIPGVPVTVSSNDINTAWNYVWIEITAPYFVGGNVNFQACVAQVQFYSPNAPAGSVVNFQLIGPALLYATPILTWQLGLFSGSTGYTTCGCYHEGRLWVAGSQPNRFDASKSNDIFNFAPTDQLGQVGASNAISYTLNSDVVNTMIWMIPTAEGIVCGTQEGEWLIQASNLNLPLAASNIQAHRVTKYGGAVVEPKRTGLTTVFVQKFGRRLLEYVTDAFSGKHYGPNLNEKSKHVTKSGIVEIAYQDELTPIVWGRLSSGTLVGTTYRRLKLFSSEKAEFNAWHRHFLGSNRLVESVCVGPSSDGLLDALTIMTNDTGTGVRHIELMRNMFDEDDDSTSAWMVDDAIVPSAGSLTVNAGKLTLYGLHHLQGKIVTAVVGGLDFGDYTVAPDGSIQVPLGTLETTKKKIALTQAFISQLTVDPTATYGDMAMTVDAGAFTIPVVVGFTYTSQGQLLQRVDPPETGGQNGPSPGKIQRGHMFSMLVHNSQGLSVGTDFTRMRDVQYRTGSGLGGQIVPVTTLYDGIIQDTLEDSYQFASKFCWQISRPYPTTVVSIGPFIHTMDR